MDSQDTPYGSGIVRRLPGTASAPPRSLDGYPVDQIREVPARALKAKRVIAREKFFNTGDAAPGQTIVTGTGPFMSTVELHVIFWGAEWVSGASPVSDSEVRIAVNTISGSAYMDAAFQYGNFGSVLVKTFFMQPATEPPANFPDSAVSGMLTGLFAAGLVPLPDVNPIDQFYVVIMPSTATTGTAGASGKHTVFNWKNPASGKSTRVRFAWVLNDKTLDLITSVFSHELVEAYTDPEGTHTQISPSHPTNWNEVGDICSSVAYVDGLAVQSYWSQQDQACVIPYFVDHGFPHGVPPVGARLRVIGIRRGFSKKLGLFFINEFLVRALNGDQFHMSHTDAMVVIGKGTNTLFVHSDQDGSEAEVKIFTRPGTGKTYLATDADDKKGNNLLSVPPF